MDRKQVERAIEAAGGAAELARKLGVTTQAISQWRRIPVARVLAVEEITGIPREKLRPDIYGRVSKSPSPQAQVAT